MLFLQLGINNTRDVWKFPNITRRLLLIPNCTRGDRMITYTNFT